MNGRTSAGAVLAAIIVGAAVGSVLVSGWLFVASLFGEVPELAPLVAAAGFVVAAPLWVGGLLLVGLPVWTVLHLCGARSGWIGPAAGAVLSLPALVPGLVVWGSACRTKPWGWPSLSPARPARAPWSAGSSCMSPMNAKES